MRDCKHYCKSSITLCAVIELVCLCYRNYCPDKQRVAASANSVRQVVVVLPSAVDVPFPFGYLV